MTVRASQNPFRVERVHALPYQLHGLTWNELLDQCEAVKHRGAIVGPHGSGKTTLMIDLAQRLREAGHAVTELFTNAGTGFALPRGWDEADRNSIVMADGYDSLNVLSRLRMRRRYSRLIVTSHRPGSLPALHVCEPRADVLAWVVGQLAGKPIDHEEADTLLANHRGNMRGAIRDLYDRCGDLGTTVVEGEAAMLDAAIAANLKELGYGG